MDPGPMPSVPEAAVESHDMSANGGGSGSSGEEVPCNKLMLEERKYLLLLAILAATVTYVAGLNPPGGVWLDTQDGHITGNQILVVTYHARYNAFRYSNATAFMASAVVILLLVFVIRDKDTDKDNAWFFTLRVVMVLDLLALMVAYATGASRDLLTTILASLLVSLVFLYVLLHTLMDSKISRCLHIPVPGALLSDAPSAAPNEEQLNKKERGILMLLSIFATTITYMAGLNPPGGFWPNTQDGHRGGDPVLNDHHRRRFTAFFICNTVSFVASLGAIMLLLTNNFSRRLFLLLVKPLNKKFLNEGATKFLPQVCFWISLFGLVVAYAAGSCRAKDSTTGVLATYLVALIVLLLVHFAWEPHQRNSEEERNGTQTNREPLHGLSLGLEKGRSLLVLLATLVAAVTYQAGLNPPGGFWPDDRDGHKGGDPILLTKHATRYRLFFYCNSLAFVTSLVVIFMIQRNYLNMSSRNDARPGGGVWQLHTLVQLVIVMVLDLIGLIGAFAAGCCRDVNTSIHVIALAGGTLVYVVFHIVFFTMHRARDDLHKGDHTVEKKRKLLLLIIILAVTLTYQAGLTPPGGFWLEDDDGSGSELGGHQAAGDPVLLSNYRRRYIAFFYLNATGFMASVALTILLVNPNLYRAGINCHALFVCMVAGLFGLMGAYAAGSSRHVRTSLYMIVLIGAVFVFIILARLILSKRWKRGERSTGSSNEQPPGTGAGDIEDANMEVSPSASNEAAGGDTTFGGNIGLHAQRKYLTLLGILAASVTYHQAGLAPPGGVWPDNNDGHAVGNPILRDSNHLRYRIFFYFNSTSFVASVVVITLQLVVVSLTSRAENDDDRKKAKFLIQAAHGVMVVDLLGLLAAYAAGSSREWETSGYIVALVAAVASYIGIHLIVSFVCLKCQRRQ